ncbi:hypothetical protein MMC22_009067 [Lobaria immixta]|nr:hypothetical protein [Lobaria immixta]
MEDEAPLFNPVFAEFALIDLAKDVRSSSMSEDLETVDFSHPLSPSTRLAITCGVTAPTGFSGTTFSIRIPPVSDLLTLPRFMDTEKQILFLSISTDFLRQGPTSSAWNDTDATRQLVALTIPTDAVKELLTLSISTNSSQDSSSRPISPFAAWIDAAHQHGPLSMASGSAADRLVPKAEDFLRDLLELSQSSDTVSMVPITSVFSEDELAVAARLINLFESNDFSERSMVAIFGEDEFLTARSLLDRFASQKRQGPATFGFSPSEIAAAHRLRALFVCNDPKRQIGPIFLAFPDDEESLRLLLLSRSQDAARHLLELSSGKN